MLNTKKLLTKILQWIKSPDISNSTNTNTYYVARRTDTGITVRFGIASAGTTHGIWSDKLNKWIVSASDSTVFVDGKQMPKLVSAVNGTFKGTKSNEWEYTGLSFSIPSGCWAIVQCYQNYVAGRPIGIGIDTNSSINPPKSMNVSTGTSEACYSGTFLVGGGATYYIYTKRATVPTAANTYTVNYIQIDT